MYDTLCGAVCHVTRCQQPCAFVLLSGGQRCWGDDLSLIHISEPTRLRQVASVRVANDKKPIV